MHSKYPEGAKIEYRIEANKFYRGKISFSVVVNGNYAYKFEEETLGL